MKRLPALLFLTFLAYGSAHAASPELKEAIKFSGVPLGSSEKDFREKFPEFHCHESVFDAKSDSTCFYFDWTYGDISTDVHADFINRALINVTIFFESRKYQLMSDALTIKYGKPNEIETEELQNRLGATFVGEKKEWRTNGVTLTINKYAGTLDKSIISYRLDSSLPIIADRVKKKKEDAAKSL